MQISHLGHLISVTFSFDPRPGIALSEAIARLNAAMRDLQVPATLSGSFSGTAQAYQSSLQGMGILIVLSIVVIYLVLGILYESFIRVSRTAHTSRGLGARPVSLPVSVEH